MLCATSGPETAAKNPSSLGTAGPVMPRLVSGPYNWLSNRVVVNKYGQTRFILAPWRSTPGNVRPDRIECNRATTSKQGGFTGESGRKKRGRRAILIIPFSTERGNDSTTQKQIRV